MEAYRVETTVAEDGELTLKQIPFRAGERVEVIVLAAPEVASAGDRYRLRGTPLRYDHPTEPVAGDDWEVLG